MAIETNDNLMAMYISSLVRSVIAIHNLINNKQELQKKKVALGPVAGVSVHRLGGQVACP